MSHLVSGKAQLPTPSARSLKLPAPSARAAERPQPSGRETWQSARMRCWATGRARERESGRAPCTRGTDLSASLGLAAWPTQHPSCGGRGAQARLLFTLVLWVIIYAQSSQTPLPASRAPGADSCPVTAKDVRKHPTCECSCASCPEWTPSPLTPLWLLGPCLLLGTRP